MGNTWSRVLSVVRDYSCAGAELLAETLWPVRCVLCETAGELVCKSCRSSLVYIDQWLACPRCGAPYGWLQCSECNSFTLSLLGLRELPYEACVSVFPFHDEAARIVCAYKDAGEQDLADFMAYCIACAIPPEWIGSHSCVVFIPATRKAVLRRGFDHCKKLSECVARYLNLPYLHCLESTQVKDQRSLGVADRFVNSQARFSLVESCKGFDIILVDDVYTTGATLCAATQCLREGGAKRVCCATFARVYGH